MDAKVTTKYAHPSGFTFDKVEVNGKGSLAAEVSLVNAFPGLKLEFKAVDTQKADLGFVYSHPLATLAGEVDVNGLSKATGSVTVGKGPVVAGASADLTLVKNSVDSVKFNLGVGYTVPGTFFVGLRANKSLADYAALFQYTATKSVGFVGKVTHSGKDLGATVAGLFTCPFTGSNIKVKVATTGLVNVSAKKEVKKGFTVVGAAEVPSSFNNVKFGVTATLG